ncbi:hypothetical protein CC1G_14003 [Coprinopsis cinerea okayama7|uniref:Uncharacterized protein n=1 Tax=Coprinopsis cinerea (strain Okayama-7 / 130 / ATCC MYA-4618 / FGSC 9003) TaxID=240176 RepID=D6RKS7_COPC7|nr:hypothetical protein CC1G_14003 [Coprinopsis cinerea okayama7\|eukprot:XP_002911964.1 hypothetical protein CC1G_14003 [Coprinopsis cinerea okayama7\
MGSFHEPWGRLVIGGWASAPSSHSGHRGRSTLGSRLQQRWSSCSCQWIAGRRGDGKVGVGWELGGTWASAVERLVRWAIEQPEHYAPRPPSSSHATVVPSHPSPYTASTIQSFYPSTPRPTSAHRRGRLFANGRVVESVVFEKDVVADELEEGYADDGGD